MPLRGEIPQLPNPWFLIFQRSGGAFTKSTYMYAGKNVVSTSNKVVNYAAIGANLVDLITTVLKLIIIY